MLAVGTILVVLQSQKHGVRVVSLAFSELGIFKPAVVDAVDLEVTAWLRLDMRLHRLLTVLLLLGDGLVLFVPLDELLADLLGVGELATLEPGVRDNVRDGESLMRVEVEHRRDQILELLIEEAIWLAVGMGRPELLGPVGRDKLVVGVLQVGHIERWVSRVQNEQDNAQCE